MGEKDSYRETFAWWVVYTKVTKVRGSDHFRIGRRGQDKLQYTMGEVDMSARLQARMQQLKDSTHQRSQSVCQVSDSVPTNANCLNISVREREGGILGTGRMHTIHFKLTSNFRNKVKGDLLCPD